MPPKAPPRPVASTPAIMEADETAPHGLGQSERTPSETAQYIAEFSAELSFLARLMRLDLLAYLLDMARLEAIRAVQSGQRRT
jgi:hypothetical protein